MELAWALWVPPVTGCFSDIWGWFGFSCHHGAHVNFALPLFLQWCSLLWNACSLNLTIWSCFIKLILKAGFQAAGSPPCLHALTFRGDLVYGKCLLLPSITCKLPTALSQPVAYTWVYIHIPVKANDARVLGNIMSKLRRLAEPVTSPSPLAFSAELLMWVIKPQSLLAPLLLICWMKKSPLFQAQYPWGPEACTYGDTPLCSSKVGGRAVLPLLPNFLSHAYLFYKGESYRFLVTFPSQHHFFTWGQRQFILQACRNLLGISNSSGRKQAWTDGSRPNLLPVNGWQLLWYPWCFRENGQSTASSYV